MGAACCRAVPRAQAPPAAAPPAAAPAAALRRPVPVRARLGDTVYEQLAESTQYGVAEYRPAAGYTWRPGRAPK